MSSGKTSKLVKYAKRLSQDYPEKVILPYLPKVDTRTPPGTVNSRDGSILGLVQPIGHCVEINCSPNGSYYIDEVQFCDKTIFDLIIYIAQNQNCGFVAAGLDLDFSLLKNTTYKNIEDVPVNSFDAAIICVPDGEKIKIIRYLLKNNKLM